MLCLIAHAAFVSVTHHHSALPVIAAPAADSFIANDKNDSNPAPDSSSDAHCLSCRLQRNFTANVHPACVVVQSFREPIRRETPKAQPSYSGSSLLLFGRAPPHA